MSEEHRESVRARVRAVPAGPAPRPWRALPPVAVGGLTEVGVGCSASGEEFVLVVSGAGRGVVSSGGVVVARDRAEDGDWYDPGQLAALGIGPLDGVPVRLAGLAGGGLALHTGDGWSVARFPVDWPDERVVLEPPGAGVLWPGRESGCVVLHGPGAPVEVRAAGFSPSGRVLVIATSAEVVLHVR